MATTEPLEITGLVVPAEDRTLAESIVKAIRKSGSVRLEADGTTFVVPESALPQIVDVLNMAAEGRHSDVIASALEWTIPEAAAFLDMSEGSITELLDGGVLEFRQDGDRCLILRSSLLAYDLRLKRGLAAMEEITRLSEEMGLYDD